MPARRARLGDLPGCHLPASSPMPPAGAGTPLARGAERVHQQERWDSVWGRGTKQLLLPSGMAGFVLAILIPAQDVLQRRRFASSALSNADPREGSAFLCFSLLKFPPLASESGVPFAGGREAGPAECTTPGMKRVLSPS